VPYALDNHRSSAATVRISLICSSGAISGASSRTARIASMARARGTRYSDWISSPFDGVNSNRKCARRSLHGPTTPNCCVVLRTSMVGIM